MTTRDKKLRELVEKWRDLRHQGFSEWDEYGYAIYEITETCADELASILDEEVEVSDSMLRRACDAYDEHQASLEGHAIPMAMHSAITAAIKEAGK